MFGGNEPTPLPTDGGCVGAGNCLTFGGWMRQVHYEKHRIESIREKRWTIVHHVQAMLKTTTCERSNTLFG